MEEPGVHNALLQEWFHQGLGAGDTCVLCGKLCRGPGYCVTE